MASAHRRSTRDLIEEISQNGSHFRFFQVVRLLALFSGNPLAIPQTLRFATPLSLAFPPSEILSVQIRHDSSHASTSATDIDECNGAEAAEHDRLALLLTVGFMGLTGPSGVLPTSYTELLIERRHFHRDTSAHGFFDMFTHRAVSLFYQAWRKHRFYLAYEAGDRNGFTRNLLDLVGTGLSPLQSRLRGEDGGIPDLFLIHFAGLLSQKPVSAMNLSALLSGYFRVHTEVEQFVGLWIPVPGHEQTRLGESSCKLGESAFAGERFWDRQTKICIRLGPLTDTQFSDFLPGQAGATALLELVRFCVGHSLACDIKLSLDKDCIPRPCLNAEQSGTLSLGYNAWLHTRPFDQHPSNAHFSLLS